MMEVMLEVLAATNLVKQQQPIRVERPVQSPGHEMAVPKLHQDSDAVFAQQDREASVVAGWLGMWGGGMLLKDILQDAVAEPEDEREDHRKTELKPHPHDCC